MSRTSTAVSWLYLAAVGLTIVAYFLVIPERFQSGVYDAIGLSAAAAMLAGTRWHRSEPPAAWYLLGFGVLALAAGDIVFGSNAPVPSPADMLYISAYPLLALGLSGLRVWQHDDLAGRPIALASAIAVTVGVLSWVFLILPAGERGQITTATRVVALGYPVMDVGLIGLLVRSAVAVRFADVRHRLLLAGLLLMFCADATYAQQKLGTAYTLGGNVDGFWLVAYACYGAALLRAPRSAPGEAGWETSLTAPRREVQATKDAGLLFEEATAGPLPVRRLPQRAAVYNLRFAVVVLWSGRALLALGVASMIFGAVLLSPRMVLLAGTYAIGGLLMWVAGSAAA